VPTRGYQSLADVDPVGREDLGDQATVPIPLDRPAANLDPGREGLKGGQGHRAAHELLALPPEWLVQFGASMPCSLTS
jgi:hypothetical protein